MRVIAFDLSCESTGVALPDGRTATILAPKAAGKKRTLADDLARLAHIEDRVDFHLVYGHGVQIAVMEDYAPGIRSASAHRLAEVGGVARLACWKHKIPIALVGTMQLKQYATGKGRAEKGELKLEAYKRAGVEFPNDDECDAWWLRALALDAYGEPVMAMPAKNREVLSKVTWPQMAVA